MGSDDPLGASARSLGRGRREVNLLSRGDRVRAVIARGPAAGAPLVVVGAPDGCAHGAFADAALGAWSSFATVAALDLPLCGARKSDKLSEDAFRPRARLAARLHDELELQLGADLARLLDWLARDGSTSPAVWLALGVAAQLEPRPRDPRIHALLRAAAPGKAISGTKLKDFEPTARNLEALAQALKRTL